MERLQARQGGPAAQPTPSNTRVAATFEPLPPRPPKTGMENFVDGVDKLLIADFFFVVFALVWFGVALAAKTVADSTVLLDTWLQLWQWVFQPAIGVLMLGSVSGSG